MSEIAGVKSRMAHVIDLDDWETRGQSWDDDVISADLDLKSTWGDGHHAAIFLGWSSGGSKSLTVSGLVDQQYTFSVFDWISGELVETRDVVATGGQVTLDGVPTRSAHVAAYLARAPVGPPPPPTYTLVVRDAVGDEVAAVPLIVGEPYELTLEGPG
jgi:hypothetical protein